MPFKRFDRTKLSLLPLAQRKHDMDHSEILGLHAPIPQYSHKSLGIVAERIVQARKKGRPVILLMGAHVLRCGMSNYLIDLMERGILTHLGGNGACAIHDYELSLVGATTESVAEYIRTGQFGLWNETGDLNDIAVEACREGIGFGEALGKNLLMTKPEHVDTSIYAAAVRLGVPTTVHVSVGHDIVHEHPNCDGGAIGEASYTDFLVFTQSVSDLEGGVFLNYGTAVMGPEVYLKALSMVRNVASREGRSISNFTTAVFDLIQLGDDLEAEAPKTDPRYYYRPFKTILVRTVLDGGESYYVEGNHRDTFPNLYRGILDLWEQ
jgi:hypothetical protein